MLVFKERGKPEYPDKNLSEQVKRENQQQGKHVNVGNDFPPP